MSSAHIRTLDGLRGVAALAVVFFHLGLWAKMPLLFSHGYLAVDFFFCLSGFVIAYAFKKRFEQGLGFWEFVALRMIRLYPIIAIGMVLGLLYTGVVSLVFRNQPFAIRDVISAFSLNIFLIPYLGFESKVGGAIYPLNSPFWSIFYEILINFAWALFLRRIPAWVFFLASVIAALIFFPLLPDFEVGGGWDQFYWGLLRVCLGFGAGLWVFELYSKGIRLPAVNSVYILGVLTIILAVPEWHNVWFDLAVVIVACPLLTLFGITAVAGNTSLRFMTFAGEISYPIYGIHRPICLGLTSVGTKAALGVFAMSGIIAFAFVASIVVAVVVSRWFDEPARKYLLARFRGFMTSKVEARSRP